MKAVVYIYFIARDNGEIICRWLRAHGRSIALQNTLFDIQVYKTKRCIHVTLPSFLYDQIQSIFGWSTEKKQQLNIYRHYAHGFAFLLSFRVIRSNVNGVKIPNNSI